ncbi:MAG: glycosyltransferase family 4 protein [Candidatus Delongbacteria bacterium]|nr:glycosyltransferase family 4 protein [Candidatus Delongbacteria bacterium]
MLNSKTKRIFFEQFLFPFKLNSLKPEILFCPSVAVPILNFTKTKIITTIHDLIPFVFKEKYSFFQRYYFNIISYLSAKKANIILTVSENSKKDIIRFLKIPAEKIYIIYNFLDKYNLHGITDQREKYFITVSTVQPGKNLERLFEAFSLFVQSNNDFSLYVIGGKGWKSDPIYKKVEVLGIKDKIIFLGYVKDKDLANYYKTSTALLYVSLYEGFGIPPLEAMSYNCPVVVSKTSSLPEVVGKAGIMVDPYDIRSILEGMNSVIDAKVVYGRKKYFSEQLDKFNSKHETQKLLNIFNEIHK